MSTNLPGYFVYIQMLAFLVQTSVVLVKFNPIDMFINFKSSQRQACLDVYLSEQTVFIPID